MTQNAPTNTLSSFSPLNSLGILQVAGEEAQSFLQNLLTNDVNALAINQSQLSGFCNAKGRLFAVFMLVRSKDAYQLILPKTMCAALQQRLSMYVLRSKVTVTDISDDVSCIGLIPKSSEHSTLTDADLISYPSEQARFIYLDSKENADNFVQVLTVQQWQQAPESNWELNDIAAGFPSVYPETKEQFTPQQVNLDVVNGVSFKKGCYPGQEIVARLHYLGTANRRLFQAEAQTTSPATVGDDVTAENGDIAGQIVRIQPLSDGSLHLLVSLKITTLDANLFINETTQITLKDKTIPE